MIKNFRNGGYPDLMEHDFSLEIFLHSYNVANIAMQIADEINLCVEEKKQLYDEALHHDIGKSKIPESILYKKDKLSLEEWEIMKLHPIYSQSLYLSMVANEETSINKAKIIRHHHENWNGTGYPDKISGEEIPLHSRIIRIADIFDAITRPRIYRPYCIDNPLSAMKSMEGKEIDPNIFKRSYRILDKILSK